MKHLKLFESTDSWIKNWRVIDLRSLVKEIGGENWHEHEIVNEWKYQFEERSKHNDSANLEWVGDNPDTPIINEYLLSHGFKKGEMVLFWVCV